MRLFRFAVGTAACFLLALAAATTATDLDRPKQVLLIYAEQRLAPALVQTDVAIRSALESGPPAVFYTEFLDLPLLRDPAYERQMRILIRLKYRDVKLDLIVAGGPRALRSALQYRSFLGAKVPIVFAAVDAGSLAGLAPLPDVTGVVLTLGWMETLDVALRLQPDTRRVVVAAGTGDLDTAWVAPARAAFAGLTGRFEFTYLTGLSLEQTATTLAALPDRTIVLVGPFTRDGAGRSLMSAEAVSRLAEASRVPIYGLSETFLGRGIVGGSLVSFETQGTRAGELALRVLRGETLGPRDIVTQNTNSYVFDWRQLRRWGLKESRLPPGSLVRLREPSNWERYRWAIIGGLLLVSLQSFLIAGLLIQRRWRKRAEEEALLQRGQLAHAQRVTAMGQLAATLAHEINTPLAAIVTNAEAATKLVDPTVPKRTDLLETLGDIINDGQRASEVIRSLRSMLRKGAPEQKPCDLNGLIVEVLGLLRAELARTGVSVELRLKEGLPPVRGDAIQLQQVVLNLVLNAEDAMAQQSDELRRLTVETAVITPVLVQVCVRDTGIGVKEGDLERIFKPFVTTKTSGLGMGLSISWSLVEAHGGRIRAVRNPDRGLSVHVELPCDAGEIHP